MEAPEYIVDALYVLQSKLSKLADNLVCLNCDTRISGKMRELAENIPCEMPTRDTLFALARYERAFAQYQPVVDEQWPAVFAGSYHASRLFLFRIIRHYPKMAEEIEAMFAQEAAHDAPEIGGLCSDLSARKLPEDQKGG